MIQRMIVAACFLLLYATFQDEFVTSLVSALCWSGVERSIINRCIMQITTRRSPFIKWIPLIGMAVMLTGVYGCASGSEKELLEKQNKIEEQSAQIKQLQSRLAQYEQLQPQGLLNTDDGNAGTGNLGHQYYFIVLDIVENHYTSRQRFTWTTSVKTIGVLNDELKYRLLDQEVSNYKNSANGIVYNGSIKKREIYLFNSYQEASKAREKYIMN